MLFANTWNGGFLCYLERERDEALWHCVGTSYYNQVVREKNELIRKLKK